MPADGCRVAEAHQVELASDWQQMYLLEKATKKAAKEEAMKRSGLSMVGVVDRRREVARSSSLLRGSPHSNLRSPE